MRSKTPSAAILGFLGLIVSAPACADAGVPMIFITLPGMGLALVPVILVEGYALYKQLHLSGRVALKASSFANVASTVIGIPLTWVALVAVQLVTGGGRAYGLDTAFHRFLAVTWQAPWLIPYEEDLRWMIPAATLTLLVPFFFVSWWIEYRVVRWTLKTSDRTPVFLAVRNANLISYGLLAIAVVVLFVVNRHRH